MFPEIKPQLVNIFERYRHVLDVELQQRACEFYALASRSDDDELLQNVCEEMPPFPPRVSALLGRLNLKHADTEDKRTWIHGGKEANVERETVLKKLDITGPDKPEVNELMADLNPSVPTIVSAGSLLGTQITSDNMPRLTSGPNVDRLFDKLAYSMQGILYEDDQIQIGVKSRYQGHIGQLAIYLGNKVSTPLTSFTTRIHVSDPDALSVTFAKIPPSVIAPREQTQQLLHVECKRIFTKPPVLSISYLAGSHHTVTLRLPIVLTKFFEHVKLGENDFFERWKLIGGPPRENQAIFAISLDSAGQLDLEKHRQVVSGHRLNILEDIDPNPHNLVAAGVLHMSTEGKVGCLLRLEPNHEAKVIYQSSYTHNSYSPHIYQLCRLTVRSTSESVAVEVQRLVQRPLKAES